MNKTLKLSIFAAVGLVSLVGCNSSPSTTTSPTSQQTTSTSQKEKYKIPELKVYGKAKYVYDCEDYTFTGYRFNRDYFRYVQEKQTDTESAKEYMYCYIFSDAYVEFVEYKTADGVNPTNTKGLSDWTPTGNRVSTNELAAGRNYLIPEGDDKIYKKIDPSIKYTFKLNSKNTEVTTVGYISDALVPSSFYWHDKTGTYSLPVKMEHNVLKKLEVSLTEFDDTIKTLPGNVVLPTITD